MTPDKIIEIGVDPVTGDALRQMRLAIGSQTMRFPRSRVEQEE